jgi:hypothetical protein
MFEIVSHVNVTIQVARRDGSVWEYTIEVSSKILSQFEQSPYSSQGN